MGLGYVFNLLGVSLNQIQVIRKEWGPVTTKISVIIYAALVCNLYYIKPNTAEK